MKTSPPSKKVLKRESLISQCPPRRVSRGGGDLGMPLRGGGDPGMHYWWDVHPIPVKRRRVAPDGRLVLGPRGLHASTGDATLADAYAL